MENLESIKGKIDPLNQQVMQEAKEYQNKLIKPLGSLGVLEDISIQFAGITGKIKNNIDKKILFLFGADNGVYEEGIASSPQEFSNWLITCYGAKKNSGINVICAQNNVDLKIVDMGIKGKLDYSGIDNRRLMEGTNNFLKEPAIPEKIVLEAINIGIEYAKYAYENGYHIIGTGEVGIGNTTTAAACIMAITGIKDPELVGRGAGMSEEGLENKRRVIARALELHRPDKSDPLDILSKVGGLDIAALTGLYLGAGYYKIPIVIDGVISIAAALLASAIDPNLKGYLFPSHLSEEPGYNLAAQTLGISPYLSLGMRLGEGTGCPMSMMIIENALSVINNMTTFEELSLESDYRIDF